MAGLSSLLRSLEQVLDGSPWNNGKEGGLRAARDLVRAAVLDPLTIADCVELELDLLRSKRDGANLVPFLRMPSLQAGLAFGHWPPFTATGPHEHTAWTITAVVRNSLQVAIYDWTRSYGGGSLVEQRVVHAVTPDVGFIAAPTIHDVRNDTPQWSLALHVLSDHAGRRPPGHPISILDEPPKPGSPDPYLSLHAARMRLAKAVQMAELLGETVKEPIRYADWFADFAVGTAAARIARALQSDKVVQLPLRRLRKVHPDLRLSVDQSGTTIRLSAHSHQGSLPQLELAPSFAQTLSFIADRAEFEVEDLPGDLTSADRQALARALQAACLFEVLH